MHLYRLVVPVVAVFIVLTVAANIAFASSHPVDSALPASAGPAQEADGGTDERDAVTDARPDREPTKHRLAAICHRLLDSDEEAPHLRARCAQVFADDAPDPVRVCGLLADRGADDEAVRRCVDRLTDGVDAGQLCRRAHEADEPAEALLERCRDHFGDGSDSDPAQICRRALSADGQRDLPGSILERCRDHFGDRVEGHAADICRRLVDNGADEHAIERCREHFGADGAPSPQALRTRLGDAGPTTVEQLRLRLLDQLQNADGELAERIRAQLQQLDGDRDDAPRRQPGRDTDRPFRVRPSEVLPVQVQ